MYKRTSDGQKIADDTSFHGDVLSTTYAALVAVFGEPSYRGSGKIRREWWFVNERQEGVRIYDWKRHHTPVDCVTEWHIGARDASASREAMLVFEQTINHSA
jgi:hypothetical protein